MKTLSSLFEGFYDYMSNKLYSGKKTAPSQTTWN